MRWRELSQSGFAEHTVVLLRLLIYMGWKEELGITLPASTFRITTLWRAFLGREAPGLKKPPKAQHP